PALVLLPRPLLAAALLLTGLLVGSLRRLRILFRIIHLSTSLVKVQHHASNTDCVDCKLIEKISMHNRFRALLRSDFPDDRPMTIAIRTADECQQRPF